MKKPIIKISVKSLLGAVILSLLMYFFTEANLLMHHVILSGLLFLCIYTLGTLYEEVKNLKIELLLLKKGEVDIDK